MTEVRLKKCIIGLRHLQGRRARLFRWRDCCGGISIVMTPNKSDWGRSIEGKEERDEQKEKEHEREAREPDQEHEKRE